MGADIDLELRGRNIEQLGRAANELTEILTTYGVFMTLVIVTVLQA